jgi:hypothetical protein
VSTVWKSRNRAATFSSESRQLGEQLVFIDRALAAPHNRSPGRQGREVLHKQRLLHSGASPNLALRELPEFARTWLQELFLSY